MASTQNLSKIVLYNYLLLIGVPLLAYLPGVSGSFLLDDYSNFARLDYVDGTVQGYLLAVFGSDGSTVDRPVSFLSFLLNASDWPANPRGFKVVNLLLHLAVTLMIFSVFSRIPAIDRRYRRRVALVMALLWSLSALHVSTVLYAVQRMTILAALFSMMSLFFYLRWRLSHELKIVRWEIFASAACVALSFLSKENGIISVLLIAALELCVGAEKTVKERPSWLKHCLILACCAVVTLFFYKSYLTYPGYESRAFSFTQRLMLQGQVIFDYIRLALLPDVNYMSLYHDSYELDISKTAQKSGYFWLIHLSIIGLAIGLRAKYKVVLFGVSWFYISHLIESSFIPLELMFEHRNYLPSVGIFFVVAYGAVQAWDKLPALSKTTKCVMLTVALLMLVGPLVYRASIWGDYIKLSHKWAVYKVNSARAQYDYNIKLESLGRLDESLERSLDHSRKFSQLGFKLHAWRLACALRQDVAVFPAREDIVSTAYSSEVDRQLSLLLLEWQDGGCVPDGYTNTDVDSFMDSILQMRLLNQKPRNKAKMLEHISSFYLGTRRVDMASRYLLMLYETQPTVETALRNIEFALAFDMLEYAEEYIEKAELLNKDRGLTSSYRRDLIGNFRQTLKTKRQTTNSSPGENFDN